MGMGMGMGMVTTTNIFDLQLQHIESTPEDVIRLFSQGASTTVLFKERNWKSKGRRVFGWVGGGRAFGMWKELFASKVAICIAVSETARHLMRSIIHMERRTEERREA